MVVRTAKRWTPSPRCGSVLGDAQGAKAVESTLHWNVSPPPGDAANAKRGVGSCVFPVGPAVIVVSGVPVPLSLTVSGACGSSLGTLSWAVVAPGPWGSKPTSTVQDAPMARVVPEQVSPVMRNSP